MQIALGEVISTPIYEGDKFGTRGDYVEGMLYKARRQSMDADAQAVLKEQEAQSSAAREAALLARKRRASITAGLNGDGDVEGEAAANLVQKIRAERDAKGGSSGVRSTSTGAGAGAERAAAAVDSSPAVSPGKVRTSSSGSLDNSSNSASNAPETTASAEGSAAAAAATSPAVAAPVRMPGGLHRIGSTRFFAPGARPKAAEDGKSALDRSREAWSQNITEFGKDEVSSRVAHIGRVAASSFFKGSEPKIKIASPKDEAVARAEAALIRSPEDRRKALMLRSESALRINSMRTEQKAQSEELTRIIARGKSGHKEALELDDWVAKHHSGAESPLAATAVKSPHSVASPLAASPIVVSPPLSKKELFFRPMREVEKTLVVLEAAAPSPPMPKQTMASPVQPRVSVFASGSSSSPAKGASTGKGRASASPLVTHNAVRSPTTVRRSAAAEAGVSHASGDLSMDSDERDAAAQQRHLATESSKKILEDIRNIERTLASPSTGRASNSGPGSGKRLTTAAEAASRATARPSLPPSMTLPSGKGTLTAIRPVFLVDILLTALPSSLPSCIAGDRSPLRAPPGVSDDVLHAQTTLPPESHAFMAALGVSAPPGATAVASSTPTVPGQVKASFFPMESYEPSTFGVSERDKEYDRVAKKLHALRAAEGKRMSNEQLVSAYAVIPSSLDPERMKREERRSRRSGGTVSPRASFGAPPA